MARLDIFKQCLLLLMGLALTVAQTDYCSSKLCGSATHIACNSSGDWSSNCPTSPKPTLVTITVSLRQQILMEHNRKRNKLASGKLKGFKPATRMATLIWSKELAELAVLNVKQCQMSHDACHNTIKFSMSGQNLALYSWSGTDPTNAKILTLLINSWWAEKKDTTMAIINKYPDNYSGPDIGHFTAMAQMKSTAVGCAIAKYNTGLKNYLLACNYVWTNVIGQPVYTRGVAASGCKTGKNPIFPALCSVKEKYL